MKLLYSLFLKIGGWEIIGDYPHDVPKKIIVAGPHTSFFDFFVGISLRGVMGFDAKYIGKDSLFKPPFGWFMKLMGGIPVDRSKSNNFVEASAEVFKSRESLTICIAPEGTRKKVEKFKTGFYYIAKLANIPILPVLFDYENKQLLWQELIYPGEDPEQDIKKIEELFRGVKGKVEAYSFT